MKITFAPMEGITLAPFRRNFERFYPGMTAYMSPFLVANQTLHFKNKEIRDILPENNQGIRLIPQILTNQADQLLWAVEWLGQYGYDTLNLNLGCSMPQVANRGRGAGFLKDQKILAGFFDKVFSSLAGRISLSVKTRMGVRSPEEAEGLMSIYNAYPLSEIIIHPRLMTDLYRGQASLEVFGEMLQMSVHPVCYNGDIFSVEDYRRITERFPSLNRIMIGRGFLRNPSLLREIQGGEKAGLPELRRYHDSLFNVWRNTLSDERQAVSKMKEIWWYWQNSFPGHEKEMKGIKKAQNAQAYLVQIDKIFKEDRQPA